MKVVREMTEVPPVNERLRPDNHPTWVPTGGFVYTPTVTGTITNTITPYITTGTITTASSLTINTTGWTNVTRDEIWNSWTINTGGHDYRWTDEQAVVWDRWNTAMRQVGEAARQAVLPTQEALRVLEREVLRQRDVMQRQREEASRQRLAEAQARQERADAAHDRALDLLRMLFTPEQLEQYEREFAVTVRGSDGGLYELRCDGGVHGNISEVDEHGCRLANLCVSSAMYDEEHGALPTPDGWVGQLLAIRHNEGSLRRNANFSMRRECRHPEVPVLRVA